MSAAEPPDHDARDAEDPPTDEHRMPRWVRAFVIAGVVAVVLVVALMLFGDGAHGPARHLPGSDGDTGSTTSDDGHVPPVDHG